MWPLRLHIHKETTTIKDHQNYSVYQNIHRRVDERNRIIQKINYQYRAKISQVKNDRRISHRQRKYIIRRLEAEKA